MAKIFKKHLYYPGLTFRIVAPDFGRWVHASGALIYRYALMIFMITVTTSGVKAQFSLVGQLRTRTEFRDGLATLQPKTNNPAFFTSQRTRLTFNYKTNR